MQTILYQNYSDNYFSLFDLTNRESEKSCQVLEIFRLQQQPQNENYKHIPMASAYLNGKSGECVGERERD